MKKCLLVIVMFVSVSVYSQIYSRVEKINGIEAYILAEPVREYEVLQSGGKGIQWGSFVTGGLINESIATKLSKYVQKLIKEYKDQNIEFDAIIYTSGKQVSAIKFTDKKTPENDRLATVQKIQNIPFFVISEPIEKYTYVDEIGGGLKWKSALTGGLVNNSIEEDLLKFAKKIDKDVEKGKVDAVIYNRGKKASAIKFD